MELSGLLNEQHLVPHTTCCWGHSAGVSPGSRWKPELLACGFCILVWSLDFPHVKQQHMNPTVSFFVLCGKEGLTWPLYPRPCSHTEQYKKDKEGPHAGRSPSGPLVLFSLKLFVFFFFSNSVNSVEWQFHNLGRYLLYF